MVYGKGSRTGYQQNLFLQLLLEGYREIGEEEAEERKQILGIDKLQLPCFVVCIAPNYTQVDPAVKDELILACERYVASFLEKNGIVCCTITNAYENVQAIIHTGDEEELDEELLIRLHDKILLDLELDQFIGIGSRAEKYGRIAISASEATDMLAYKYQYAERGVINIANIVRFQYNSTYGSNEVFERVVGCFRDGDLPKMAVRMDELVREIRYRPKVSGTSIKRTMIELTVHLLTIASNAKVDVDSILQGEDPYNWIVRQETTEVITDWIMRLATQLLEKIREQQKQQGGMIIQTAKDYIQANLGNPDIGLQSVSKQVGLSGPYLSRLFKEEMGIGLSGYITAQRINMAKELLLNTGLKNEEIARQTGFSRVNYYCSVFKKEVGCTPGSYRKNRGQEQKSE